MTEKPRMSVHSLVVCEEIRREYNNKGILLGVYTGKILPNKFPALIRLALWLLINSNETGEVPFKVRGKLKPSDVIIFQLEGSIDFHTPRTLTDLPTPTFAAKLEGPGELYIQLSQHNEDNWTDLRVMEIALNPNPSSSDVQQPSAQSAPVAQV
jgi:hypothetical protein